MSCVMEEMDGYDITHTETHTHTYLCVYIRIDSYTHTVLARIREQKDVPLNLAALALFGNSAVKPGLDSRLCPGHHPAKCSHTTGAKQAHAGPRSG